MNAYLLNRALGSITPSAFQVAQTTRLVQHLEPASGIRFSSQKKPIAPEDVPEAVETVDGVFAHRAGTNALAIDQYEGRL